MGLSGDIYHRLDANGSHYKLSDYAEIEDLNYYLHYLFMNPCFTDENGLKITETIKACLDQLKSIYKVYVRKENETMSYNSERLDGRILNHIAKIILDNLAANCSKKDKEKFRDLAYEMANGYPRPYFEKEDCPRILVCDEAKTGAMILSDLLSPANTRKSPKIFLYWFKQLERNKTFCTSAHGLEKDVEFYFTKLNQYKIFRTKNRTYIFTRSK